MHVFRSSECASSEYPGGEGGIKLIDEDPYSCSYFRYGYGPDVRLVKTVNGSVFSTLRGSPGSVRFADFSPDGEIILAASDGEKENRNPNP